MRGWTQRCRWLLTQLTWDRGEPDSRVLQSLFAILVVAAVVLRSMGEEPVGWVSWPMAGLVLSVVGGIAVLLVPVHKTLMSKSLAVVHIAAIGMVIHGSEPALAAPLVMLPSIWLGLVMGMRGALLATLSVAAFISVPMLLEHGVTWLTVQRSVILPGLAGFGAFSTSAALTRVSAAQARAEAREAELAEALDLIERNERSAQAIFDTVDVGLALFDTEGEPVLGNKPLLDFYLIAYPEADRADGWVFDETGRRQLAADDIPTARACRGEEFDDVRVWIGKDERSRRAMSISARRVEDVQGNWIGAAVSYSDVTDLMNALQVKDDFIAMVSHELRTPLTSIIGYVSMDLEMDDLPPLLRKHLEIVARNGERLERLVEGLLEEVEHSGRPLPVQKQDTDLAQILRHSVDAARRPAERSGIDIQADLPDFIDFTGDPQRLAQLFDHLLSNAIKYNEPGGQVVVGATIASDAVTIRVTDTGIGISPEDHEQVFTRFFRTDEANRRAIQGVGLGLSAGKSIVGSHDGRIDLESQPGRGSEFRVVFPRQASRIAA